MTREATFLFPMSINLLPRPSFPFRWRRPVAPLRSAEERDGARRSSTLGDSHRHRLHVVHSRLLLPEVGGLDIRERRQGGLRQARQVALHGAGEVLEYINSDFAEGAHVGIYGTNVMLSLIHI